MHKILLLLGVIIILAGCSPAAPEAAAAAVEAPQVTDIPPTEEAQAPLNPWKVVGTSSYRHAVQYSGFLSPSHGVTVGYAGEVHYTTDGGTTWLRSVNHSMCRFGLEVVDEKVAWHCGNGGHVRLSTDGGKTWDIVTNFGSNEPNHCRYLSFLDATTGWAAAPGQLGATSDGGQTWQNIALPDGILSIIAMDLRTPQDGYLLGSSGNLYLTADGGKSWTTQSPEFMKDIFPGKMPSPLVAMRFVDEKRGMVVLSRGNPDDGFFVWSAYTEDGGASWQLDQVTFEKGIPYLFLSRDASTLTVLPPAAKQMTVLQFQQD